MPCAIAFGAPSARADHQDDNFLQTLKSYGIALPSDKAAAQAIEAAKLGCNLKAQGMTDGDAWARLKTKYPSVNPNTVFTTLSVGILTYCPQYLG